MFEPQSRETSGQTLLQTRRSESVPVHETGEPYGLAADEADRLRTPARRERPFEPDEDLGPRERSAGDETRKSWRRRHPIAVALALPCVLLALPAGYLYWDYTSHFEYTDDAYIAARQFAIAPEVPGYITAVPVTDNQHVAAGGLVARIDDRTYRAALAQAEAQVAAARASIDNIDAQLSVQQAQIAADQAQLAQQQAALVFAQQQAARYQDLAKTQLAGTVQNAQKYTSQLSEQQAAVESAQATLKLAQRQVEALKGAARQRHRKPCTGQGPARRGANQPRLYDRHGRPARPCRATQRRGRAIRAAGHKPDNVRPR
jgi:membrane fusion protein, multidrug efflux system